MDGRQSKEVTKAIHREFGLLLNGEVCSLRRLGDIIDKAATIGYAAANQWISVEDRLPPMAQNVLLLDVHGEINVSALEEPIQGYSFEWGDAGMRLAEEFTHWMELPSPPKEI